MNEELNPQQSNEAEQLQQYAKIKGLQLQETARYYKILEKLDNDSNLNMMKARLESTKLTEEQRVQLQQQYDDVKARNEQQAMRATLQYREGLMKMYSDREVEQHYKAAQAQERNYREGLKQTARQRMETAVETIRDEVELEKELEKIRKETHAEELKSIEREREARRAAKAEIAKREEERKNSGPVRNVSEGEAASTRTMQRFKALTGGPGAMIDSKLKETEERANKARAEKAAIQEEMQKLDPNKEADREMLEKLQKEFVEANKEAVKAGNAESAAKTAKAISNAIAGAYKSAFSQAENMLTTYQAHIDARLQGSEKSYEDITDKITSNLSTSPFVKTVDVLEKLKEATDQGIVYNVEQRAFLATIADKIANTFNAFDSNLLRLIRLQQADTTAARLGMEASLTKLFNSMFNDTSYLNDAADTVAAALLEASSIMDKNKATEFEYIVQKWLGSLSSLGMDTNTINKIAEGINYIATGDVTSLANNSSLQTLFAMSASNANLEYSQLLLNGLDVNSTNDLLRSMVEYLKKIAEESDNNVVRSAYSDIFDLSVSDMRAISNLTDTEIDDIHGYVMTYQNMEGELNTQMKQLSSRMNIASMLSNVYENVVYGVASDMVNNPATYGMQKMLDFMVSEGVNFNIPFINAMGFGLDLNAGVTDLLQLAVGASQATMLVTNLLQGLGSSGGTNLDAWGFEEYNQRGDGFNFAAYSTLGGTSGSAYVSNSSTSDQNTSAISSATDDAEETGKITGKNQEVPEKTTDDFYEAIIGDNATEYVKIRDDTLLGAYDDAGRFLRVQDSRFYFDGNNLKVIDVNNGSGGIQAGITEIKDLLEGKFYPALFNQDSAQYVSVKNSVLDNVHSTGDQALRVILATNANNSTTLSVNDTQLVSIGTTLDAIHTLLSTPDETATTVKLADGTTVDVKKDTLIAALRDVLFEGNDKSINNLLETVENGNLVVKSVTETVAVKTPVGEKLQVSNLTW